MKSCYCCDVVTWHLVHNLVLQKAGILAFEKVSFVYSSQDFGNRRLKFGYADRCGKILPKGEDFLIASS